jgi:hypothetical protein
VQEAEIVIDTERNKEKESPDKRNSNLLHKRRSLVLLDVHDHLLLEIYALRNFIMCVEKEEAGRASFVRSRIF